MATEMAGVLVDTCVLLDVLTEDPQWFAWSAGALQRAADAGPLVVNPVIYAELSAGIRRIEEVEELLLPGVFEYRPISREAAFLAGRAFAAYRQRGGSRPLPLPDFFIGAQASVECLPLLTRDVRRFRTYFPRVQLVCP